MRSETIIKQIIRRNFYDLLKNHQHNSRHSKKFCVLKIIDLQQANTHLITVLELNQGNRQLASDFYFFILHCFFFLPFGQLFFQKILHFYDIVIFPIHVGHHGYFGTMNIDEKHLGKKLLLPQFICCHLPFQGVPISIRVHLHQDYNYSA